MKKFLKILLIAMLILPVNPAFAATGNVSIACPTSTNPTTSITCTISGNGSIGVSSVESTLLISSNLTFVSFANGSGWTGVVEGEQILLYTDTDKTGNFVIGVVTLKTNADTGTASVKVVNTVYSNSAASEEFSAGNAEATISVQKPTPIVTPDNPITPPTPPTPSNPSTPSNPDQNKSKEDEKKSEEKEDDEKDSANEVYLKSLKITGYDDFKFSKKKFSYDLDISDDCSLDIAASPEDPEAKVQISGNNNLKTGSIIKISATKGDLTTVYQLKITKNKEGCNCPNAATVNDKSTGVPWWLFLIYAVILLIIAAVIVLLATKKRKDKTDEPKEEKPEKTEKPAKKSKIRPNFSKKKAEDEVEKSDRDAIIAAFATGSSTNDVEEQPIELASATTPEPMPAPEPLPAPETSPEPAPTPAIDAMPIVNTPPVAPAPEPQVTNAMPLMNGMAQPTAPVAPATPEVVTPPTEVTPSTNTQGPGVLNNPSSSDPLVSANH